MERLGPAIDGGVPVVVLEPSCASVFRDELTDLFPDNLNAKRLSSQTLLLSEFLRQKAPDFHPPQLDRKALVQGHCHHKSIMKMDDENAILEEMKIDADQPEAGCCGMAGAFGFEEDHYDVAVACGERSLLPAVRLAPPETIVIADGFSCREQIAQMSSRRALHLAEVIDMAVRQETLRPPEQYPEKAYAGDPGAVSRAAIAGAAIGGLLLAGAWRLWRGTRRSGTRRSGTRR
jgi:Fe-S oxidoreductase